jgi:hypothetical protein
MQPFITLKGAADSTTPIIQPVEDWLDGGNFKEATLDVWVLQNTADTSNADLVLETAISPSGPWTALVTFGTGATHVVKYYTSNEEGTDQFERFIRWKLDRSSGTLVNWTTCFRICAVVK